MQFKGKSQAKYLLIPY